METILIIEDDTKLAALLSTYLSKYEFRTIIVEDFNRVMETFNESSPNLVLLDANLPRYDGFYWCRQIRTASLCPILFISARDSGFDQVMALENGGDDYITKPFHNEVVLAKIRSHLRRAYGSYSQQHEERKVQSGDLILYPERYVIQYNGQTSELTQKEAILLEGLLLKEGRVVNRERLLDLMWEDQHFIDDNTLNVYITRVRRKLMNIGLGNVVETVRGAGYRLNAFKDM
ncbi:MULTISPECIES: response regulator transcription factor [unclassified Paenibacillus]|uniref:response regulator transcription factor n=1 Tax=unclassified Paenibacillus TaxID=185978 RepID=UPI0024050903|nr:MULTISPECIES: response regulator transcription factor [unclassified Paenibacillus]MDF9840915.1 OmpR family two-component system response regulator YxdJ [Paenibacillus sp. PastF-2]MDF9847499.1 OmpR family two-component system response regulator YxdJ [Paenibacillus sp. PastM-2]MDF9853924.1 OmpR family two-component system response regulator YxdJ [Paenibacillus sp. PastF-1]MDH6479196.1 OmpR family two-component system response regulator YxdJ [Paenibacillus sp. PastH-2]MDH6507068.1 OmpR family 